MHLKDETSPEVVGGVVLGASVTWCVRLPREAPQGAAVEEVGITLHWTTSEGRSYRSMVQSEPINLKLLTITNNGEFITTMSVTSDS